MLERPRRRRPHAARQRRYRQRQRDGEVVVTIGLLPHETAILHRPRCLDVDKLEDRAAIADLFAKEPEAKAARMTKKTLADAMARLFAANKLRVVTLGSASHDRTTVSALPGSGPRHPSDRRRPRPISAFQLRRACSWITARAPIAKGGRGVNGGLAPRLDTLAGGAPCAPVSPPPGGGKRPPSKEWRQQLAFSFLPPPCGARARGSVSPAA